MFSLHFNHACSFCPLPLEIFVFPSDEGQVILVYGADYGRRDRTTCSYQRPAAQIQNVYCSHPTGRVAERYSRTLFVHSTF